jgi:lysophospholipase L1-like esterase
MKTLISFSLILNLCFFCCAGYFIDSKGGMTWVFGKINHYQKSEYRENRMNVFSCLPPISTGDTVFLGDSILDFGEWGELITGAKNRAISGSTTSDVIKLLPSIGNPRHIILSIGGNNFQGEVPLEQTKAEYRTIINSIPKETHVWILPVFAPNADLYELNIRPGHPGIHRPEKEEVAELNSFIKSLESGHVRMIDMPELLHNGELSAEYTLDGLHLNGKGLRLFAQKVEKAIAP